MGWEAQAAYRVLLDASWTLGPIRDPEAVLRALGLPPDLWDAVRPCWVQGKSGWTNKRLEEERALAQRRHDAASASARARWTQRNADA